MDRLRILILEDRLADAELMVAELRRAGLAFDWQRFDNERDFAAHLNPPRPDLILADFNMPQFTALRALQILKEQELDIPLIIVSGSVGEETAVNALHEGAVDYLLKDRLTRLGTAANRALEAKRLHDKKRQAEEDLAMARTLLHTMITTVPDYITVKDVESRYVLVNEAYANFLGLKTSQDLVGKTVFDVFPRDLAVRYAKDDREVLRTEQPLIKTESRTVDRANNVRWHSTTRVPLRNSAGETVGVLNISRDITDQKRAEEQIKRQLETLTTLYASAQKLSQTLDLTQLAQFVVETSAQIFGARFSWVGHAQSDGAIRLLARWPEEEKYLRDLTPRWDDSPLGRGPSGRAIRSGLPVLVQNIATETTMVRLDALLAQGLKSAGAFPLISRDKPFGVLALYSDESDFFNATRVEFFQAFAHLAAASLENGRLLDQSDRRAREFGALYDTSLRIAAEEGLASLFGTIAEHAVGLIGADGCAIGLYDARQQEVELVFATDSRLTTGLRIPEGVGVIGQTAQTKTPVIVDDGALHQGQTPSVPIPTGVGVPIIYGTELVGVIGAYSGNDHRRVFTRDDVRLLTLFATQAAVAVHTAKLLDEQRRRLQQLQALRDIDTAITGSVDVRVTLNILLDKVTTSLSVDAADLLLFNPHSNTLEFAAGRGFRTQALQHTRLPLGSGYAGSAALERTPVSVPDLPGTPGEFERSSYLRAEGFIGYYAVPLLAKGQLKGVLEIFHRKPLAPESEWTAFLSALAGQAAIALDNATLLSDLQRANVDLTLAYDKTLEGWSRMVDLRDRETEDHTRRVTDLTVRLARVLGVPDEQLVHIRRGALLHDIGKLGVPDGILHKPGPLTDEEWVVMRKHPVVAHASLWPTPYLRPALDIPRSHHEKWDGTGYPDGLKGDQIPLAARIFAVVDVYDALTSDRPYRKAWAKERALDYIREQSGKHFDPAIVAEFLQMEL